MDCNAARLMLSFPQNGPEAPTGPEAQALREHLDGCAECDAAARLDAHVGRAVRDVPVPDGLRARLLARLAAEREEAWRRLMLNALRGVAAAAAVLIAVGVGLWVRTLYTPRLDLEDMHVGWNIARPTNGNAVEAELRSLGYPDCAPDFVNYDYLCATGVGPVPGYPDRQAPRITFVGPRREHVLVIAVPRQQLAEEPDRGEPGYRYQAVVEREGRWAFVLFYTGDSWDWLKVSPAE